MCWCPYSLVTPDSWILQLHECLAQLITENLEVKRWLFKLDDEFDGRGIAYVDVAAHMPCYQWALKEAQRYGEKWTKKWAQVCLLCYSQLMLYNVDFQYLYYMHQCNLWLWLNVSMFKIILCMFFLWTVAFMICVPSRKQHTLKYMQKSLRCWTSMPNQQTQGCMGHGRSSERHSWRRGASLRHVPPQRVWRHSPWTCSLSQLDACASGVWEIRSMLTLPTAAGACQCPSHLWSQSSWMITACELPRLAVQGESLATCPLTLSLSYIPRV